MIGSHLRKLSAKGAVLALLLCLMLEGCGAGEHEEVSYPRAHLRKEAESGEEKKEEEEEEGEEREEPGAAPAEGTEEDAKEKTYTFVDVYQNSYEAELDPRIPPCDYDKELFMKIGSRMTYEGDSRYRYRRGIDVSEFNGEIDWKKVKKAGMEFVFIRAGYRGYGDHAGLVEDKRFRENLEGASKAGLDIGLYFFSQALTPEEARQEAEYMVKLLDGRKVSLPLVCDLEHIEFDQARTDDLTPAQASENVRAFCRRIGELGYRPMFYSNLVWEAFGYELETMTEIPIWYADYEARPQTPYRFSIWQYSCQGQVDGIPSKVDLDIELISAEGE